MNFTSAYLRGELSDDLRMTKSFPIMFENWRSRFCGLNRGSRERNQKLYSILKQKIVFHQCESEPCVYTKNTDKEISFIAILQIAGVTKGRWFESGNS